MAVKSAATIKDAPAPEAKEESPGPLSSHKWMAERLSLDPRLDKPKNRDATTQLAHKWLELKEEKRKRSAHTFDFCAVQPGGTIAVVDPDGLALVWRSIGRVDEELGRVGAAIKKLIDIGHEYVFELENACFANSVSSNRRKAQLANLVMALQGRNRDLTPEQILTLPEYQSRKAEFAAEDERSVEAANPAREKLGLINNAIAEAGC